MATAHLSNRSRGESDPLARALRPATNETPQERQARLEQEALSQKISDAIDEQLRKEKLEKAKKRQEVRILLLGTTFMVPPLRRRCSRSNFARSIREWQKVRIFPSHRLGRLRRFLPNMVLSFLLSAGIAENNSPSSSLACSFRCCGPRQGNHPGLHPCSHCMSPVTRGTIQPLSSALSRRSSIRADTFSTAQR